MTKTVCPDGSCPAIDFADTLLAATTRLVPVDTAWARVYDSTWGFDEPNPGLAGNARFSPFRGKAGSPVPTIYVAGDVPGALLETLFRYADTGYPADNLVYDSQLNGQLLAEVANPLPLLLVDLSNDELSRLGVPREAVAACGPRHYPCTRAIAAGLYEAFPHAHGILWQSRQAEFQQALGKPVAYSDVAVIFTNRTGMKRGQWRRLPPGPLSLSSGAGRTLIDELAIALDIEVVSG